MFSELIITQSETHIPTARLSWESEPETVKVVYGKSETGRLEKIYTSYSRLSPPLYRVNSNPYENICGEQTRNQTLKRS